MLASGCSLRRLAPPGPGRAHTVMADSTLLESWAAARDEAFEWVGPGQRGVAFVLERIKGTEDKLGRLFRGLGSGGAGRSEGAAWMPARRGQSRRPSPLQPAGPAGHVAHVRKGTRHTCLGQAEASSFLHSSRRQVCECVCV